MKYLYTVNTVVSLRPVRHLHTTIIAASIVASLGIAPLKASTVSLAFQAEISQINGDVTELGLPFPLVVGQQINGRYVFSSEEDLVGVFLQPLAEFHGSIAVTIGDSHLNGIVNFGLIDNSGIVGSSTGPIASLFLTYFSPSDVFPGWGGDFAGTPWNSGLELVGPEDVVLSAETIVSADVWNQLNVSRRLDLAFGYFQGSNFRIVNIEASVGNFTTVPEPRFLLLFGVVVVATIYKFTL